MTRFPIRFDTWYRALSSVLLLRPADSYLELDDETVLVRMGWAFHARFPRSAVADAVRPASAPLSRGVHGFAGRWLVNGSGDGIVALQLSPPQRGRVLGVPVRIRELSISLDAPDDVAARLAR